jgi:transposase
MVLHVPDAQLDEYCAHIWDTFAVKITKGQLSHILQENGISWKKVEVRLSSTYL